MDNVFNPSEEGVEVWPRRTTRKRCHWSTRFSTATGSPGNCRSPDLCVWLSPSTGIPWPVRQRPGSYPLPASLARE